VINKEATVTEKTEQKRIKSSALPWFITSRLRADKRRGLSEVEQACLALEVEGMPCPMHVDPEEWVRTNFSYICFRYHEKYPVGCVDPAKAKAARKKKKKQRQAVQRQAGRPPVKKQTVSGVDVASTEFLSTFEWRKLRMQALKKYGPRCMCCGATPSTGAVMNVDHIKPRKNWPSLALDIENLQILCDVCNHGKGNWDSTDWRK
jgi:5-methylcytosine-specific restriction endonuclease McrA